MVFSLSTFESCISFFLNWLYNYVVTFSAKYSIRVHVPMSHTLITIENISRLYTFHMTGFLRCTNTKIAWIYFACADVGPRPRSVHDWPSTRSTSTWAEICQCTCLGILIFLWIIKLLNRFCGLSRVVFNGQGQGCTWPSKTTLKLKHFFYKKRQF